MTEAMPEYHAAWHVLHTRPKCEKKMHGYLDGMAVENYLPLRAVRKTYQRRRIVVELPLFPGYMFARFDRARRLQILRSQCLVRIIPVPDQARLIRELEQVKTALETNPFISACPALSRGDQVRITSGPLCGMDGIINTIRGETRFILTVTSIGQGVAVEVAPDILEKI